MVNPVKTIYDYFERSGVRRDLPVMKRMFVEAPHLPIGFAVTVMSIIGVYVAVEYYRPKGIGYQYKYTVVRPDDPKIPLYRDGLLPERQSARDPFRYIYRYKTKETNAIYVTKKNLVVRATPRTRNKL